MKEKLVRIILSITDIQQALSAARIIYDKKYFDEPTDKTEKVIARSLQCSMIVSYIRPFSGNSVSKYALSRPNVEIDKKLTANQWETHEHIKKLRDEQFAHTDANGLGLTINTSNEFSPLLSSTPFPMHSKEQYMRYIDLFEAVDSILIDESIRLRKELTNMQGDLSCKKIQRHQFTQLKSPKFITKAAVLFNKIII